MYRVIERFLDAQDDLREYKPGDVFPAEGITVTAERAAELSGYSNARGYPLIERGRR